MCLWTLLTLCCIFKFYPFQDSYFHWCEVFHYLNLSWFIAVYFVDRHLSFCLFALTVFLKYYKSNGWVLLRCWKRHHRQGEAFLVQALAAVSAAAGRGVVVGWQQAAPIVSGLPFRIQMVGPWPECYRACIVLALGHSCHCCFWAGLGTGIP